MNIDKYSIEISLIKTELKNLANGHYFEILGKKGIARASTIADKTFGMFCELIEKIENDKESMREFRDRTEL